MNNKDIIFKVGDKVFDAQYGFGIVTDTDSVRLNMLKLPIRVKFDNEVCFYTLDGKDMFTKPKSVLSFTEYDFVNGGFSQERKEELPKIGDVVWVRDRNDLEWTIMHFIEKQDNCYVVTEDNPFDAEETAVCYKYLTTLNPYKK